MSREPTEMELRCAKAAFAASAARAKRKHGYTDLPWEKQPASVQESHLDNVRAVIRAMRKPTDEMTSVEGVHKSCHMCGGWGDQWPLMIDAASPP